MISRLSGTIVGSDLESVTIDINGVGYRVAVTGATLATLAPGAKTILHTYLAVRENALDLYGFESEEERDFFELLLLVPSIGPKSALAIMSLATLETLRTAIATEDVGYLTKVSGIGRKTAERIVMGLKDKVGGDPTDQTLRGGHEAVEALQALGYSAREAQEALRGLPTDVTDVGECVKAALKTLNGNA